MRSAVSRRIATLVGAALLIGASAAWGDDGARNPEEMELAPRIAARIAAEVDAQKGSIRVAERDGLVVLQGEVMILDHSLRAEQIAWTTSGVLDVDNEIRVVPTAPGTDGAIEKQVRTILKAEGRFEDTSLRVLVQAGVVTLSGHFQNPADVLALKHRVASVPGVVDVRIEALLVASSRAATRSG